MIRTLPKRGIRKPLQDKSIIISLQFDHDTVDVLLIEMDVNLGGKRHKQLLQPRVDRILRGKFVEVPLISSTTSTKYQLQEIYCSLLLNHISIALLWLTQELLLRQVHPRKVLRLLWKYVTSTSSHPIRPTLGFPEQKLMYSLRSIT